MIGGAFFAVVAFLIAGLWTWWINICLAVNRFSDAGLSRWHIVPMSACSAIGTQYWGNAIAYPCAVISIFYLAILLLKPSAYDK